MAVAKDEDVKFCKVANCHRYMRYKTGHCTLHSRQIKNNGRITNNKVSKYCSTINCVYWAERKDLCCKCAESKSSKTEKRRAYHRAWTKAAHKQNPNKYRHQLLANRMKSKYGITMDHYYEMLKQQNDACKICKHPAPKTKRLAIDHNHTNGNVRGLLCNTCNQAIGMLKEDITIMQTAIMYIQNEGNV